MSMVFEHLPNTTKVVDTQNDTAFNVIATDGTGYTTLALLAAASKVPWPSLEQGFILPVLTLNEDNGSGLAGSGFYFKVNSATQPASDAAGEFVSGAGVRSMSPGRVTNIWIKKLSGTDRVFVEGRY